MFDPNYLRDFDRWFLENATWSRHFLLAPRKDFLTGQWMWATYAYRARKNNFTITRWYNQDFAIWYFLTR
jgi:hypothetical protein